MNIYGPSTDLSGLARSLPIAYSQLGALRGRYARWRRERRQRRALREARRETKRADKLKLRHRVHRALGSLIGGA